MCERRVKMKKLSSYTAKTGEWIPSPYIILELKRWFEDHPEAKTTALRIGSDKMRISRSDVEKWYSTMKKQVENIELEKKLENLSNAELYDKWFKLDALRAIGSLDEQGAKMLKKIEEEMERRKTTKKVESALYEYYDNYVAPALRKIPFTPDEEKIVNKALSMLDDWVTDLAKEYERDELVDYYTQAARFLDYLTGNHIRSKYEPVMENFYETMLSIMKKLLPVFEEDEEIRDLVYDIEEYIQEYENKIKTE
jgi:hypothetical protein